MTDKPVILCINGCYVQSLDVLRNNYVGKMAENEDIRVQLLSAARDGVLAEWLAQGNDEEKELSEKLQKNINKNIVDSELANFLHKVFMGTDMEDISNRYADKVKLLSVSYSSEFCPKKVLDGGFIVERRNGPVSLVCKLQSQEVGNENVDVVLERQVAGEVGREAKPFSLRTPSGEVTFTFDYDVHHPQQLSFIVGNKAVASYTLCNNMLDEDLQLVELKTQMLMFDGSSTELLNGSYLPLDKGLLSFVFTLGMSQEKPGSVPLQLSLKDSQGKVLKTWPHVVEKLFPVANVGFNDIGFSDFHIVDNIKYTISLEVADRVLAEYCLSNKKDGITVNVNGQQIEMVWVEGGTFQMGRNSSSDDEQPVHSVTLDGYYIGKYEVTQALWQAVMGSNPSKFKGNNNPVEQVTWGDCQLFVSMLNQLTGRHFALPTEAQWEYAARGGNKSNGYRYSGGNKVDDVAWYNGNSKYSTYPVGQKAPNELGIYDMSGNVWEWCEDWYAEDFYSKSSSHNPVNSRNASYRVLRGGSWNYNAEDCRVAIRGDYTPPYRGDRLGLRLVLLP